VYLFQLNYFLDFEQDTSTKESQSSGRTDQKQNVYHTIIINRIILMLMPKV